MTSEVVISNGTDTVTLTNYGVSVSYRFQNPLIIIPTPGASPGASNSFSINLAMFTQNYDLTFTLPPTGGGCGRFDFSGGTTDFEKIGRICQNKTVKPDLTINGLSRKVAITAFTTTWQPGMKDLAIGCRLSLAGGIIE